MEQQIWLKEGIILKRFYRITMIQILCKFLVKMKKDRVRAHAAEAAFFIIMSFFPAVMLLLALLQFTPFHSEQIITALETITPFEITPALTGMIQSVFDASSGMVPWTVLAALWAGGKGIMGLSDGLHAVYGAEQKMNYFVIRIRAAAYTILMILAIIISLGVLVFGYWIKDMMEYVFPFLQYISDAMVFVPVTIAIVLLAFLFTVLYAFLPAKKQPVWKQIPGAIFTAVSWAVFSYVFSIYLEFSVHRPVIYGSLTTLVVVMLWLYICMYLFFVGAEMNHYITEPEAFS